METTRHFVATVYIVNEGATALHDHERLGMWLPPGGHVDRDELPHEAAIREVREETGLDVDLLAPVGDVTSETVRSIPQPQQFLLEDIDVYPTGEVGHQHVDFVYYGRVDSRDVRPDGDDEAAPARWKWFTRTELRENARLEPDVAEIGRRAIEAVEAAAVGGTTGAAGATETGDDR
ncbi:NUDIX hydrolase [Halomarina halobia]|uniref:NUDIX hydrolase n=1 Tax=Halomarina halobia TaxID=3033386 RepID=A0ABD6A610_9EURY|nr:NUDIX domain-containing protein [Halomarina sp. PSR21]